MNRSSTGRPRFDSIEYHLLMTACRELTLDHACASWSEEPRRIADITATRIAAQRLTRDGLIWFYLVDDGYPDVDQLELDALLDDEAFWHCDNEQSHSVGVFLTTEGEDVILGLWDGGIRACVLLCVTPTSPCVAAG